VPHHSARSAKGRIFSNQDAIIAAARDVGLPVEVVVDLGKLQLREVVQKMAGVGILIAAHGAALVNAMFLPQVRMG
jgi:capsular polysaccharide biosynthesis protein